LALDKINAVHRIRPKFRSTSKTSRKDSTKIKAPLLLLKLTNLHHPALKEKLENLKASLSVLPTNSSQYSTFSPYKNEEGEAMASGGCVTYQLKIKKYRLLENLFKGEA
jgi:hypothetical protein